MRNLNFLCLSPLLLLNMAWAGGQNAPAYSHPQPKPHHHSSAAAFTGFTVMGAVGGVGLNAELKQQYFFGEAPEDLTSFADSRDVVAKNVAGLIGLGYGYQTRGGFFLGLNATAGANYVEIKDRSVPSVSEEFVIAVESLSVNSKAKLENDFALLLKLGYVMHNKTLFYALVGPRWGNFKTSTSATFDFAEGGIPFERFSGETHQNAGYVLGITAGAGITQMLSDHFEAGIEYAFTSYGDLDTLNVFQRLPRSPFVIEGQVEFKDNNTNTLMATLAYKF